MRYCWIALYQLMLALILGAAACRPTLGVDATSHSLGGQSKPVIGQNSQAGGETLPDPYDNQALKTYQDMLKLAREMGDRPLEGMALVGVGSVYTFQEKFSLALEHLEPGLKIAQEFKDRVSEKRALNSLVAAYLNIGNYDQASVAAKRLLAVAEEEQNLGLSSTALQGLGAAQASKGNLQQAIQYHQRALRLARQLNEPDREAIVLTALGETYLQARQPEQAVEALEQAKAIQKQLQQSQDNPSQVIQATDTWNIVVAKALALRKQGQTEQAVAAFAQYGEMFAKTDPTAERYSLVAQQFTQQLSTLGLEGGAYIYEVFVGDVAAKAGLRQGDIVIAYNGQSIGGMDDLEVALKSAPKGQRLPMTYLRLETNGQFRQYQTTVSHPLGAGLMPI